jgi:hypothetical protein
MKRRRSAIFSALSLALCVATCVSWVRSYRRTDDLIGTHGLITWEFASGDGSIWVERDAYSPSFPPQMLDLELTPDGWRFQHYESDGCGTGLRWAFARDRGKVLRAVKGGILWSAAPNSPSPEDILLVPGVKGIILPYWLVALICIFPLLISGRRAWTRRQRQTNNRCPSCGYDLRATPERCPECGTTPPRGSAHIVRSL